MLLKENEIKRFHRNKYMEIDLQILMQEENKTTAIDSINKKIEELLER